LHCHFLGHGDRGMMLGVQAICPDRSKDELGNAKEIGPEYVEGNFKPAARRCEAPSLGPF
jgi:hypothetical protein